MADAQKMIRVKFNTSTMIFTDSKLKFNPENMLINDDMKGVALYPNPSTYKSVGYGDIVDLTEAEYNSIKDKTCVVTNPRMGNLQEIKKQRLSNATPSERSYLSANMHEFESATWTKPICEIVA